MNTRYRMLCLCLLCALLCGCTEGESSSPLSSADVVSSVDTDESSTVQPIEKPDFSQIKMNKGKYSSYENPVTLYSDGEMRDIIAANTDFTVDAHFFSKVPSAIDHVSVMHKYIPEQDELMDFYRSYLETFAYLFPDEVPDENCLFYYGKNSHISDGNTYDDVKTIGANWEDFCREKKEDVYYMFYSPYFHEGQGTPPGTENRFLELQSPVGAGLTTFNKGKLAAFVSELNHETDDRFLETYIMVNVFSPFDSTTGSFDAWDAQYYSVDSEETVLMTDGKEIAICDAVRFYEDYINAMPHPAEAHVDFQVIRVHAIEVADSGRYCLQFSTTPAFEGIPFDYEPYGVNSNNSGAGSYEFLISTGYMAVTDDVDAAYGVGRVAEFSQRQDIKEIVPVADALRCCAEKMSQYVEWEILSAELVYCAGNKKAAEPPLQGDRYDVRPCYRFVLHNPADEIDYLTYVDAVSGEYVRYTTAQGYKVQ